MGRQYFEQQGVRIQSLEVGDKFITKGKMVGRGAVDGWLTAIGLTAPHFLSDEHAQKYGFKCRVVPAPFTFSFTFTLLFESGILDEGLYMGTDKARFPIPVYAEDTLRSELEVLDRRVTSKGDRVVIRYKWLCRNQRQEIVAEGENTCIFPVT